MPTKIGLLAILSAAVLGLTGCGEGTAEGGDDDQPEGGGAELFVEAHDFRFEIEGATLPESGQDVTVRMVNEGDAPHTFSSEEVGLDIEADPGGEGEGTFTVPDDGTSDFQCNIHPDQMKLTLTTGEPASSDTGSGESESESEDDPGGDDLDY
ncbi:MAG: hypothetical protein GEU78_00960 [Actinobacteria bacterium]|nr:hypothetical protein [Actinomycetota bacterium]